MKLKHLFVGLLVFHVFGANAQIRLSANLQQYLNGSVHQHGVFFKQNGTTYISVLLKINEQFVEDELLRLGGLIGTRAGNIYTAQLPESNIHYIIQLKGIDYIQMDEPIAANMDAARKSSRVDSVHAGLNLPQAYTGKNVVVGIIDAGFDYGHPTFYDTTGTRLRVKRVWEQKNQGTPPQGFSYGNELTDTASMVAKGYEVSSFSHGTHVGGIAGGSGFGGSKYRGVAYESDLVFVGIRPEKTEWKTMGMSSIVDGIQYILNYAQSVGKPAVVNLSWGCSIGPNDGSSLFSQAVNNLLGPGRIFVLSAGNNGEEKIHLQKTFTAADTVVNTFVSFPLVNGEKRNWIDIWGDSAQSFCVNLALYNGANKGTELTSLCLTNLTTDTFLVGTDGDTCFLTITAIAADYNHKPHVLIDAYSKTTDMLNIGIKGNTGNIHMWQGFVQDYIGYYGSFDTYSKSWATSGDVEYTLGEMASTEHAITVAAYASKISFKNLQGLTQSYSGYAANNQIVPFSSHGPTTDGRIKPDITAPGMTLASAVNSYDVSYAQGGGNYGSSVGVYTMNGRNYYYAEASGTSMSSPMVAGIVALLLEVNPSLSPQRIKEIIFETAIKDNFTTPTPNPNRWGAGKINAYQAVRRAVLTSGMPGQQSIPVQQVELYPNPHSGTFGLRLSSNESANLLVSIFSVTGSMQSQKVWNITQGNNTLDFTNMSLQPGMYWVRISGPNGIETIKKMLVYEP